jgi:ABC-type multidrug transport system fused ATPase/permease subunit
MRAWLIKGLPSLKVVKACLNLLDPRDRFLLIGSALIQMSLVFLDVIGILLIGSIVAIATSAVQGKEFPDAVQNLVEFLGLQNRAPQDIAVVLAVIATLALLGKSFLSYFFNLKNFKFLAMREARLATNMAKMILSQPITSLQRYTTPDYLHSLGTGASSALTGILGGIVSLAAELSLQLLMATTLLVFSPTLLLVFLIYFGAIFLILHIRLGGRAIFWNRKMTEISIFGSAALIDSLGSYREIVVSGKRDYFLEIFNRTKLELGALSVKNSMLGQFSKYVFENGMIIGGVVFAAYAFFTRSALEAASLLAIFVTASSRIAPSVMRIQLGILMIKGALGATTKFFEIYEHLRIQNSNGSIRVSRKNRNLGLGESKGLIRLDDVTFTYPEANKATLHKVSCEIQKNKLTAIVGPSGSGKSTMVDLILGVLEPSDGDVSVFGVEPTSLLSRGIVVGYVPQSVYLKEGSILENICFGIPHEEAQSDQVWKVLDQVLLGDWIRTLPDGLNTNVGERGSKLSGGQRQRLGIARALYPNPTLLVLDEATSSLDSISEHEITQTIGNLGRDLTTIVIAHRLSTVLNADTLIYLQRGKVEAVGTFQELRERVADFDKQAELMGIDR